MAHKFCSHCGSEVEDTGGFCLLGHRLAPVFDAPPPPPPPAMDDLTAEVSSVFDAALAAVQQQPAPAPQQAPEPPVQQSRYVSSLDRTWAELESAAPPAPDDPINTFAPPPRMDWGPRRGASRFRLRRDRVEASV